MYFGTASNPPLVKSGLTEAKYDPGELSYGTTYYWKVVVKDNKGGATEGSVWKFTTISNTPTVDHNYVLELKLLADDSRDVYPGQLYDPKLEIELYQITEDGTSVLLPTDHASVTVSYELKRNDTLVDQGQKNIEINGGQSVALSDLVDFEFNPQEAMAGKLHLKVNLDDIVINTTDTEGNATVVSLDFNSDHLEVKNDEASHDKAYVINQPRVLFYVDGELINDKVINISPKKVTLEATLEGYNPNMDKYVSVDESRVYNDSNQWPLLLDAESQTLDFSSGPYGAYAFIGKTTMNTNTLTSVATMLVKLPQYCDEIVEKKDAGLQDIIALSKESIEALYQQYPEFFNDDYLSLIHI